jgi:hypothetical protein
MTLTPDAMEQDAGVGAADGSAGGRDSGSTADASSPASDASTSAPDAVVSAPDATTPAMDAAVPDATSRVDAGAQVRCTTDSDCGPPARICEFMQCIPGCGQVGGLQCTGFQTCDANTGRCVGAPTCVDDQFENNDTRQSASSFVGTTATNLAACPGDDDFYSVMLAAMDNVTVSALFSHAEGDLRLRLYDPSGQLVSTSQTPSNNESLTYSAAAAGAHTFEVDLVSDTGAMPGNRYDLQVSVVSGPCLSDALEPNNTPQAATNLAPMMYPSLHACPGDDDVFAIRPAIGQRLSASILYLASEGEVGLQLFDWNGQLIQSAPSINGSAAITYNVIVSDWHYFRVYLAQEAGNTPGAGYVLTFTVN